MASLAQASGVLRLLERADGRADRLRVLAYHRIVPDLEACPPGLASATPAELERQMAWIRSEYRVVDVGEVLDRARSGRPLSPRSVLVTFDDAYRDFADFAWPVLRALQVPVTLFVPTAFPDHPERVFWWDRLHHALVTTEADRVETPFGVERLGTRAERIACYRRLRRWIKELPGGGAERRVEQIAEALGAAPPDARVLGWDDLRRLAREGVSVGSHSRSHPMLHRISIEEARAEIAGSLRDLEEALGSVLPIFAYPGGGVTADVARVLSDEGIELAFTTIGGVNDLRSADPLRLRRVHVGARTTRPVLRARLLGVRPPSWIG